MKVGSSLKGYFVDTTADQKNPTEVEGFRTSWLARLLPVVCDWEKLTHGWREEMLKRLPRGFLSICLPRIRPPISFRRSLGPFLTELKLKKVKATTLPLRHDQPLKFIEL